MSKYSEAAGLPTTSHETGVAGTTAPPVPPAPPEPVTTPDPIADIVTPTENPLDSMPVATSSEVPPTTADIPPVGDFKWMSKIKLEEIGRTLGIELDRRLSQPKLVEQLENHIASMDS